MPWWAWMLLGMAFATRCFGWRRRAWRGHHHWMRSGWMDRGHWGAVVMGQSCGYPRRHQVHRRSEQVAEPAPPPVELSPQQKRERAMADLRRRYVADDITVEEYERELDRLIREK